jgi:hypothetical protein
VQVRAARSWAIFCMGLWLMGTVATAIVASENFFTIYRLLEAQANPTFAADVQQLGPDAAQDFLKYLSSELNRLYFQWWNIGQLAIGMLCLWLVVKVPAANRPKWVIVAMLAIVLFLTVLITPRIVSVGRALDFVPRDPAPAGMREFGLLHATYTVFDGVELILGILGTLWLTKLKD